MSSAINYLLGPIEPEREREALRDLCAYLVGKGKYRDEKAALRDAGERVDFLEKADMYAEDPALANASREVRSIHALISAHQLRDLLAENDGRLPAARPPEAKVEGSSRGHSITDVFGSIAIDLRRGLSRQQILTKLQDGGLASDNAVSAYEFVLGQRRKQRMNRLLAAGFIVVLSFVMFLLSGVFL